jgi:DNA-binding NarL/FixJ family response regulator
MAVREAVSKKPLLATVHANPLSQRELEVIRCIIEGMKNLESAEALFISAETVKSHVSTVIQKHGVRDRTQIAVFALTYRLNGPDL